MTEYGSSQIVVLFIPYCIYIIHHTHETYKKELDDPHNPARKRTTGIEASRPDSQHFKMVDVTELNIGIIGMGEASSASSHLSHLEHRS